MNDILTLFNIANGNINDLREDSGDSDSIIHDLGIIAEDMNCINALNRSHNKQIQGLTTKVSALCFSLESASEKVSFNDKIIQKLDELTNISENGLD